ncbi:hypothetical protein ACFSL4_19085 [Streptomyces caeni]|uniref:DUF4280 domain-containing protein n=1 Tax=Streptomyces caeni TaxID=2307231 RepID=A0ABW4ITZ6_9ACTN
MSCAHGGQAVPTEPVPRVLLDGEPAVTAASSYTITGCPFLPPDGNGPCVSAQWVRTALRVTIAGSRALLSDGGAVCTPTGTPLTVPAVKTQVRGI